MKKYQLATLALLVALFLILGAFGGPHQIWDVAIIAKLAAIRQTSPELTWVAIVLTQAGSAYGTIGAVVAGAGWLWHHGKRHSATLLLGAMVIERLTVDSIKLVYDRPRPAVDLHPVLTSSSSYPSGHAANSLTAFALVAMLAVPAAHRRTALSIAVPLALLVGLTRPYLGVHWPSDVLGGWTAACAALLIAAAIARHRSIAAEQQHQIVGRHGAALDQG